MKTSFTICMALAAAVGMAGCADPDATSTGSSPVTDLPPSTTDNHDNHEEHAHPSEGPHGGDLIELGNEEYHAELIHPEDHDDDAHPHEHGDDDHQDGDHKEGHDDEDHADHDHAGIVIYILDGSAKEMVAIEVANITLNLSHDGKPEQFKLAAMPTDTDPEGKSSRFSSDEKDLLEHFHEEEIEGTLVLKINGKSYRGKVAHDHEGHGHGEHGHGEHDH